MVDFISIQINKEDIIYDEKVRKTKSSNGILRLKKQIDEGYVIFPIYRKNSDGRVLVAVDEILRKTFRKDDEKEIYLTELHRRYAGRKCIVISAEKPFRIELPKRDIIYTGNVKKTYSGQGIIRLKDKYLGSRVYSIFPLYQKNADDKIIIGIEEIYNLGVHPDNDHMGGVLFSQNDVDRMCIIILQEG